jgi:raffinose/stachyose/melibiose transport system permease protein/N-acetylglucosamine transport system permease protein
LSSSLKHAFLGLYGIAALFPIALVFSVAVKSRAQVASDPFSLFTSFSFDNLTAAWTNGHFSNYFLNSLLLTVPSTAISVAVCLLAGYAFARLRFPFRTFFFYLVLFALLVPFFAFMIPLFYEMRAIGLLNTVLGANLVIASGTVAVGTFFMRAFFSDLPDELEQAARLDGCSELQIFLRVMLPLVRSGMVGLVIYIFVQNWNNFLVPLIMFPNGSFLPLPTGLYAWSTSRINDYGAVAAAAVVAILPILVLFVIMQRQFTRGFIMGAVKG